MEPKEAPGPHEEQDVAGSIRRLFEDAAAKADAAPPEQPVSVRPESAKLMLDAVHRALDRMTMALTVVSLKEWRERRGR